MSALIRKLSFFPPAAPNVRVPPLKCALILYCKNRKNKPLSGLIRKYLANGLLNQGETVVFTAHSSDSFRCLCVEIFTLFDLSRVYRRVEFSVPHIVDLSHCYAWLHLLWCFNRVLELLSLWSYSEVDSCSARCRVTRGVGVAVVPLFVACYSWKIPSRSYVGLT